MAISAFDDSGLSIGKASVLSLYVLVYSKEIQKCTPPSGCLPKLETWWEGALVLRKRRVCLSRHGSYIKGYSSCGKTLLAYPKCIILNSTTFRKYPWIWSQNQENSCENFCHKLVSDSKSDQLW